MPSPPPSPRHAPKHRAFTLVELLTVIAIIGVLTALVGVGVSSARNAAKTARCAGNLRQLGSALLLYTNEHNGALPPGLEWDRSIAPYLGIKTADLITDTAFTDLLTCPVDPRSTDMRPRSYVASAQSTKLPGIGVFSRNTTTPSLRLNQFTAPNRTILLCEKFTGDSYDTGLQFGRSFAIVDGWLGGSGPKLEDGSSYHGGDSQNYVFADGHVESLTATESWKGGSPDGGHWRAYTP